MQKLVSKIQAAVSVLKNGKLGSVIQQVRLSPARLAALSTRLSGLNKLSTRLGKGAALASHVMLSKHVVQAVNNGDITSLAFIGGRIGGEAFLRGLGS